MGYYSTMEAMFRLKKEAKDEVLRKLKEMGKKEDGWAAYYEDMQIDDDGYIEFADWHRQNYYTDELAAFLAPYIDGNGTLEFKGEDGDVWGYEFENGKAYHLVYEKRRGKEVKALK